MKPVITNIEDFIKTNLADAHENCPVNARYLNSFFIAMGKEGFVITNVYDGEEHNPITNGNRFEALDHIFGVDDSYVTLKKGTISVTFTIVLDCYGEEVVADYSIHAPSSKCQEIDELLDKVFEGIPEPV